MNLLPLKIFPSYITKWAYHFLKTTINHVVKPICIQMLVSNTVLFSKGMRVPCDRNFRMI